MEIKIRNATIEDYEELCSIYAELDDMHRERHPELFVKPEGCAREKELIEDMINDDGKVIFVAEAESGIIGFADCYLMESRDFPVLKKRKWAQLDNIAVKRSCRESHVGTKLLEAVEEWTRSKGISRLELKVYHFNEAAVAFYTRKGFRDLNKTMFLEL